MWELVADKLIHLFSYQCKDKAINLALQAVGQYPCFFTYHWARLNTKKKSKKSIKSPKLTVLGSLGRWVMTFFWGCALPWEDSAQGELCLYQCQQTSASSLGLWGSWLSNHSWGFYFYFYLFFFKQICEISAEDATLNANTKICFAEVHQNSVVAMAEKTNSSAHSASTEIYVLNKVKRTKPSTCVFVLFAYYFF